MADLTFAMLTSGEKESYLVAMRPHWKACAEVGRKIALTGAKAKAKFVAGNVIATIFALPTWGASYLAANVAIAATAAIDMAPDAAEFSRVDAKRKQEHDKLVAALRTRYSCEAVREASFDEQRMAYVKSLT